MGFLSDLASAALGIDATTDYGHRSEAVATHNASQHNMAGRVAASRGAGSDSVNLFRSWRPKTYDNGEELAAHSWVWGANHQSDLGW
jgi:hypothetical protein